MNSRASIEYWQGRRLDYTHALLLCCCSQGPWTDLVVL
jgi:hypothetical protein